MQADHIYGFILAYACFMTSLGIPFSRAWAGLWGCVAAGVGGLDEPDSAFHDHSTLEMTPLVGDDRRPSLSERRAAGTLGLGTGEGSRG